MNNDKLWSCFWKWTAETKGREIRPTKTMSTVSKYLIRNGRHRNFHIAASLSARSPFSRENSFAVNIRKNWTSSLAVCAIVIGVSIAIYFIVYANRWAINHPHERLPNTIAIESLWLQSLNKTNNSWGKQNGADKFMIKSSRMWRRKLISVVVKLSWRSSSRVRQWQIKSLHMCSAEISFIKETYLV